uniref:Uncharacterized protein n=1 Tax=Ananas comosus var. bracteatus TaxID=296719 RepID=A0A6V7QHN0_ANACO|nr:unnamed protein product [Ananas comosus var. bracteatus]
MGDGLNSDALWASGGPSRSRMLVIGQAGVGSALLRTIRNPAGTGLAISPRSAYYFSFAPNCVDRVPPIFPLYSDDALILVARRNFAGTRTWRRAASQASRSTWRRTRTLAGTRCSPSPRTDRIQANFVGRIVFDLTEVPLAPQWYKLEDKKGDKLSSGGGGELMLAVWIDTQADEAFPDAWHSVSLDVLAVVTLRKLSAAASRVPAEPRRPRRVARRESSLARPALPQRHPDLYISGMICSDLHSQQIP